jgi:hypothetical protein
MAIFTKQNTQISYALFPLTFNYRTGGLLDMAGVPCHCYRDWSNAEGMPDAPVAAPSVAPVGPDQGRENGPPRADDYILLLLRLEKQNHDLKQALQARPDKPASLKPPRLRFNQQ